jgi:hypothetical protein
VIKNLAKDGHQLEGKWGFYNDHGSFNVSIVLHSDGSYVGYANGSYPETNMKRTWKYNYLKHSLVFHHSKSQYRDLNMDLQAFEKGKVQLMDVDSTTTFQYVKEGSPKPTKDSDKASSTESKPSTPAPSTSKPSTSSSSSSVTKPELIGTGWNLVTDTFEYRGLFLNDDGTSMYSWNNDGKEETYRGTWRLDGNNIVIEVYQATQNYEKRNEERSKHPFI